MEFLAKETNGKSYNTEKYSFDMVGVPSFDYDDDPNRIMKWETRAETEIHKKPVDLTDRAKDILGNKPILTYFLDGSRHTYKVDDISYNKQVYPVIAGQIGVGCCKRVDKLMQREAAYQRLVIALPKVANADGWGDDAFFGGKTQKLNNLPALKRFGVQFEKILCYDLPKDKRNGKLEDSGIAKIQDYMIESEKETNPW